MPLYLVTGGAGFIGSHLCDALIAAGNRVRILDDFSTGRAENVPTEAELTVGCVTDPLVVRRAADGVDGIFHLAAVASVQKANERWLDTHRVNLGGTVTVLEAAAARKTPVVYASSAAVYGRGQDAALRECDPVEPLTAYGADKLASEAHARIGGTIHGVPTAGFRFFNVYGPRQDPSSPYSGVISIFASRIAQDLPITIFGDGEQCRDFIHVSDIVNMLLAGLKGVATQGPVFNACTGTATSLRSLISTISTLCGRYPEIHLAPARSGDIRISLGNPTATRATLNVAARVSLRDGLATLLPKSDLLSLRNLAA